MPAVWTDDPTIGNALGGVASAVMGGPMLQLHVMETMAGLRQRALEYQRLQQQMASQKAFSDQLASITGAPSTGLLGSGGPMIDDQTGTGTGNIGQSAPSPNAAYKPALSRLYQTQAQAQIASGDYAGAMKTINDSAAMLGEDYGAQNAQEAFNFHNVYSNLKGDAANNYASQLENHVGGGNQLTIPQAMFMGQWAKANAPLASEIVNGQAVLHRGQVPVTPAMLAELRRNRIDLTGFPEVAGGAPPPPQPGQQTQPGQQPPASAGGAGPPQYVPGTGVVAGPGYTAAQEAPETAKIMQDPIYQNAESTEAAAGNVVTALSHKNAADDRAAMQLYVRSAISDARLMGKNEEDINDLTSKLFQWQEGWNRIFKGGGELDENTRKDLAAGATSFAANAKNVYDQKYGEGSVFRQNWRARGLNPDHIIPGIHGLPKYDKETFRWPAVPEAGQPAPGPQAAPGPQQAPGSAQAPRMLDPGDVRKRLGL